MSNKPTEAQIKEFWKWCGFKREKIETLLQPYYKYKDPDGDYYGKKPPPIDLNNLFKYAVPTVLEILDKKGYAPPLMKLFQLWYDKLVSLAGDSSNIQYATLALFWAIWEVIHNEV